MGTETMAGPLPHGSPAWQRAATRAKRLSWLTLAYLGFEGVIGIIAALLAGSVALLAFSIDSAIQALLSIIIVWRFTGRHTLSETADRRAQHAVAVSFFLLAPYIAYAAVAKLASRAHPETSWLGIALSAFALAVMPVLHVTEKRLGARLDSQAVTSESKQSLICAYLAAGVLIGLLANTALGWWWLDSVVALAIAALCLWEGVEAWRGEED